MPRHATRTSFKKGCTPWSKGKKLWGKEGILGKENPVKGKRIWKAGDHPKGMLGKEHTEESRRKMSDSLTGRKVWNKGIHMWRKREHPLLGRHWGHHSEESKRKIGATRMGDKNPMKRPEVAEKVSKTRKKLYAEGKLKHHMLGKHHSKETIKKMLRSLRKRPTSFEQKIIDLCAEEKLPFKYVGDGQVIFGFSNPDFINYNGQKFIIETYSTFWHSKEKEGGNYEKKRSKIFAMYGFKTLFLNEIDLLSKDWKRICSNKIQNFIGGT